MPMLTVRSLLTASLASVALALPAAAQSFTLDFAGLGLNNYNAIPTSYGNQAGLLGVSYASRTDWGNSTVLQNSLFYWNTAYNDLVDVAFASSVASGNGSIQVGEVTLTPLGGNTLYFGAADVGAFSNVSRLVQLRVYDVGYNLLYTGSGNTVGSTTHASFAPNLSSASGLRIQWSGVDAQGNAQEAYNVGIDNVSGRLGPTAVTTPEPATFALMVSGLALLGVAARRRDGVWRE